MSPVTLLLSAALALSLAAGAEPSDEGPAALCVSIERPDGTVYVPLTGSSDGPVWLPVEDGEILAVQVLGELEPEEGRAVVRLGAVRRDRSVEPVATYAMPSRHPVPLRIEELSAVGLRDPWILSLETVRGLPKDCAQCQGVICCPAPGRCLLCGLCGKTCRAAPAPEPGSTP